MADVLGGTFCCAICEAGPPGDESERTQLTVVAGWMLCRFHLPDVLIRLPRGPIAIGEFIMRARYSAANPLPPGAPLSMLHRDDVWGWAQRLMHVRRLRRIEVGQGLYDALKAAADPPEPDPVPTARTVADQLCGVPLDVVTDLAFDGWRLIDEHGLTIRVGRGTEPVDPV